MTTIEKIKNYLFITHKSQIEVVKSLVWGFKMVTVNGCVWAISNEDYTKLMEDLT